MKPPQASHPFATYIRLLGRGKKGSRSLTEDEARDAMAMILVGAVDPMQVGAFLMLLRVKEETPEEMAGFVRAAREQLAAPAEALRVDLDWSSYAGKRQHAPWFILAALALADGGTRVLMHGAGGHTPGRLYTEQALAQLGIEASRSWPEIQAALDSGAFAYLPLEAICPRLGDLLQLKPLLGLRSVANSLVRLINPCAAPVSLHSIFHPRYGEIHQQALLRLGQPDAAVFKGEGGEIERKPDAVCDVLQIVDGKPGSQRWPRLLEGRWDKVTPDSAVLRQLWRGEGSDRYGEQAVLATLAVALHALHRLETREQAQDAAELLWRSRNRSRL
jgi:anthranilate phosphoribosyltransferase